MSARLSDNLDVLEQLHGARVEDVELDSYSGLIVRLTLAHKGTDDGTVRLEFSAGQVEVERWPWDVGEA